MTEPLLVKAGDSRVMLGHPLAPPKVDCRVVAEETYQALIAAIPDAARKKLIQPAPRPLSSLTDEEARELYWLAHTEKIADPPFILRRDDCIQIGYGNHFEKSQWGGAWSHFDGGLEIYGTGEMHCYTKVDTGECDVEKSQAFNAVRVVRYLDSLGIALG